MEQHLPCMPAGTDYHATLRIEHHWLAVDPEGKAGK